MQKTLFIVNPISGINRNPQKIVRWIDDIFSSANRDFEIVYTRAPGEGTELARKSREEPFDMVVAVGGDGTINEIGQALINSNVCLGVIPAGSGNGFARNFDIPLDQRKAVQLLLDARQISIDVGSINDHLFFNVAGMGLDAEISKNFEEFGVRGPLPYFLIGTRSFFLYQANPVKVICNGKEHEFSPLLLSIANAPQYGNGAIIAPSALPDDGLLDICVLDRIPMWKAVPNLYRLFNGTIEQIEGFHTIRAEKFTIERAQPGTIHTDGNPLEDGATLEVKVLPGALRVAVGKNFGQ